MDLDNILNLIIHIAQHYITYIVAMVYSCNTLFSLKDIDPETYSVASDGTQVEKSQGVNILGMHL